MKKFYCIYIFTICLLSVLGIGEFAEFRVMYASISFLQNSEAKANQRKGHKRTAQNALNFANYSILDINVCRCLIKYVNNSYKRN